MIPINTPEGPLQTVSVDLIGKLPESKGFNAICIFVNRFSKQMHLVPMHTELTSEGMAHLYRDHIFHLYGIPQKVIHD